MAPTRRVAKTSTPAAPAAGEADASGPRVLSVRNDSLPLPWSVVGQGQTTIEVRRRESVSISLPVQRSE